MSKKKVLLAASYSIIEPLGLFHLSSIARKEGWEPRIVLSKEPRFNELEKYLEDFQPEMLGVTLYTGGHNNFFNFFKKIKKKKPGLKIIVGGPHATYFPKESLANSDYVVISEGFNAFRRILRGEVEPGIIHPKKLEEFPETDRESFYQENPAHRDNSIKNVITHTGCPYSCTYCYNSCSLETLVGLEKSQVDEMHSVLGPQGKLFPKSKRSVDSVIKEVENIQEISPFTKMIYFQDDVFGADMEWLREFEKKYANRLPFHVNMRFEFTNPKSSHGKERLELFKKAGCTGISYAIESANKSIREEVLHRKMDDDVMFDTMHYLRGLDIEARTFQMLGLPLGATKTPTKINLESDLETLELNVRLKEETGHPTISWASTFIPYKGTEISTYCDKHGFYQGDYNEVGSESYRIRSILNFPQRWVGPGLCKESQEWLPPKEQEEYKNQINLLMNLFAIFSNIKGGHELARRFLTHEDKSYFGLGEAVRFHVYDTKLYKTE